MIGGGGIDPGGNVGDCALRIDLTIPVPVPTLVPVPIAARPNVPSAPAPAPAPTADNLALAAFKTFSACCDVAGLIVALRTGAPALDAADIRASVYCDCDVRVSEPEARGNELRASAYSALASLMLARRFHGRRTPPRKLRRLRVVPSSLSSPSLCGARYAVGGAPAFVGSRLERRTTVSPWPVLESACPSDDHPSSRSRLPCPLEDAGPLASAYADPPD